MAVVGLILLVRTDEIQFKYFSITTIILGLVSLIVSFIYKTHYAPLLVSQFLLGTFSGLFQLNQLDFIT